MTYERIIGTRAQVWHGTVKKTKGGLTKADLMMNKHGRIVSRRKHNTAKRENRLVKAGYLTKKGHFGFIKADKKSRKMRGGVGNQPSVGTASYASVGGNGVSKSVDHFATIGGKRHRHKHSKNCKHCRSKRGGMYALSPSTYKGEGVGTSGAALQLQATTM